MQAVAEASGCPRARLASRASIPPFLPPSLPPSFSFLPSLSPRTPSPGALLVQVIATEYLLAGYHQPRTQTWQVSCSHLFMAASVQLDVLRCQRRCRAACSGQGSACRGPLAN